MRRKLLELLAVAAVAALADQLVKYLVSHSLMPFESIPVLGDWVRITFVYNEHGAFSLAPQRLVPFLNPRAFYVISSSIAAAVVLWLYLRTDMAEKWSRFALMLILGGWAGNFIDRARMGRVIDFIDCDFPDIIMERWPVFNVADSCVTVGITILIIVSLFSRKHGRNSQPAGGGDGQGQTP